MWNSQTLLVSACEFINIFMEKKYGIEYFGGETT